MKQLEIKWQMSTPPIPPTEWHIWKDPVRRVASGVEIDKCLMATLGWPQGVGQVLLEAFEKKLPRKTGWDISRVANPEPYQLAAFIYKRGVGCSTQNTALDESGRYEIKLGEKVDEIREDKDCFYVVDGNVEGCWELSKSLRKSHVVTLTEASKDLVSATKIIDAWKEQGRPKHWIIVAGGILSDVAAFAAFLVDCSFEFVPTTLLAMADACVGGKTGVNLHPAGKNQLGAFAFPTKVTIIPEFLTTLDERLLKAGGAECLKHCFLENDQQSAKGFCEGLSQGDVKRINSLILGTIEVKAKVVAEDPTEKGRRASLNFGHTLAHAMEGAQLEDPKLLHGEAVAVGMAYAADLSQKVAGLPSQDHAFIWRCLRDSGCLLSKDSLENYCSVDLSSREYWKVIMEYIKQDKKIEHSNSSSSLVLLQGLGQAHTSNNSFLTQVEESILHQCWTELLNKL